MSYIYLCYHPDDTSIMETIRERLRELYFIVEAQSVHDTTIRNGRTKLHQEIDDALCMVVFISPSAQESIIIKDALYHGYTQAIPCFPILISGDLDENIAKLLNHETLIDFNDDYRKTIYLLSKALKDFLITQILKPQDSFEKHILSYGLIPRILVTGTAQSGKSEYVRIASGVVMSTRHPPLRTLNPPRAYRDSDMIYGDGVEPESGKHQGFYLAFVSSVIGEKRLDNYVYDKDYDYSAWHEFATSVLVFIVDSTRPETFAETREIIQRFHHRRPLEPVLVVASKQDCDGAILSGVVKDLLGLPSNFAFSDYPLNFDNHRAIAHELMTLLFESARQTTSPKRLVFNPPMLSMFDATPIPPQSIRSTNFNKISVSRANPLEDVKPMAMFLNRVMPDRQYSAKSVYMSFADYGYLIAKEGDYILGLMRFQQIDYICTVDYFLPSFTESAEVTILKHLLNALHKICEKAKTELIIIPNYEKYGYRLMYDFKYYRRYRENLFFLPWREAFERLNIDHAMTKQLRDNLILDPV